MPSLREKQLQERKDATLDVALRLLMQHGYTNLNMDDLAVEVGLSKPTLYQYFTSKDELIAQALLRLFVKMETQLNDLAHEPPLAQLQAFLRASLLARAAQRFSLAPADQEGMRAIFKEHPEIKAHIAALKARLDQIVRQAQAAGQIDPAMPAWVVVNLLLSLQRVLNHPLDQLDTPRSVEDTEAAIASVVSFFGRGLSVPLPVLD